MTQNWRHNLSLLPGKMSARAIVKFQLVFYVQYATIISILIKSYHKVKQNKRMPHKKHPCSFLILLIFELCRNMTVQNDRLLRLPLQLHIKGSLWGIENTTCLSYRFLMYLRNHNFDYIAFLLVVPLLINRIGPLSWAAIMAVGTEIVSAALRYRIWWR